MRPHSSLGTEPWLLSGHEVGLKHWERGSSFLAQNRLCRDHSTVQALVGPHSFCPQGLGRFRSRVGSGRNGRSNWGTLEHRQLCPVCRSSLWGIPGMKERMVCVQHVDGAPGSAAGLGLNSTG